MNYSNFCRKCPPLFKQHFLQEIFWNEELYYEVPPLFLIHFQQEIFCNEELYPNSARSAPLIFYNIFCRDYFGTKNKYLCINNSECTKCPPLFLQHFLQEIIWNEYLYSNSVRRVRSAPLFFSYIFCRVYFETRNSYLCINNSEFCTKCPPLFFETIFILQIICLHV